MMDIDRKRNAYFVPGEGIAREVITADICKYLDNDAVVRPGEYQGKKGYILHAYRNLTSAMLDDLRSDSRKWEQEKRQRMAQPQQQQQQQQQQAQMHQRQPTWNQPTAPRQPDYLESTTHHHRQQARYPEDRNSPSPSMPPKASYHSSAASSVTMPNQTPSPSQFPQQVPPPYIETQGYSTQQPNGSYSALPTMPGAYGAPVSSPSTVYSGVQSPDSVYAQQSRGPSFGVPSYPSNNNFDNQTRQPQHEHTGQRGDTGFDFSGSRGPQIPGPPASTAAATTATSPQFPQPPHTTPPMPQRDSPYGGAYSTHLPHSEQRSDPRGSGADTRPAKRPYQPPEPRRFDQSRNQPTDNRRRR